MKVLLPQFYAPTVPLTSGGFSIKSSSLHELRSLSSKQSFIGRELFRHSFSSGGDEDGLYATVEVPDIVASNSVVALADLLTKDWCAILKPVPPVTLSGDWKSAELPRYRLTKGLVKAFADGVSLLAREKRLRISTERWHSGVRRTEPVDSVLDMCSALEACFGLRDELRLRLSFAAYFTSQSGKRRAFSQTYSMYGIRNDFIHGSKIPDVSHDQRVIFVEIVAGILLSIFRNGELPSADAVSAGIVRMHGEEPNNVFKGRRAKRARP